MGKIMIDNLHYDPSEVEGYQKPFIFVVSPREAGKTSALIRKSYRLYRDKGLTTIILRRRIADITEVYINDLGSVISKFYDDVELSFKKGSIKDGIIDVYLKSGKTISKTPIYRVIALSNPMSRIKSTILRNVGMMIFDEFICNTRCNEKYLNGEAFIFQEIYNTYVRECPNLRVWFLGNPYSLYNPYTSWLSIPTNKIKAGTILSGPNWVFQAYELKDELKAAILAKNPLYKFDDTYTRYAFSGEAVNDSEIIIIPSQPRGYSLKYVFKIEQKYVAYFYGNSNDLSIPSWWCSVIDWKPEYKRRAWCFDFDNLSAGSEIMNKNSKSVLFSLSMSIQQRNIAYGDVEASYLTQEVYPFIGG